MSGADPILELMARIEKTQRLLHRIVDEYRQFLEGDFKWMGKKNTSAMVIAELMVDYYTFLRESACRAGILPAQSF